MTNTAAKLTQKEIDLVKIAYENGITNPKELARFMGQCEVESGNFYNLQEGFRYKTYEGFVGTFSSTTNHYTRNEIESARLLALAGKPEVAANMVYGPHRGVGHTGDDGWRYSGKGYIQLTWKSNYEEFNKTEMAKATGIDFVNNPEMLRDPQYGALAAVHFWEKNIRKNGRIDPLKLENDDISLIVNGVGKHLKERRDASTKWEGLLTPERLKDIVEGREPVKPEVYQSGINGSVIEEIQTQFYFEGLIDRSGIDSYYGKSMTGAAKAYQEKHGLPVTGKVDEATKAHLDERYPVHDSLFYNQKWADRLTKDLGVLQSQAMLLDPVKQAKEHAALTQKIDDVVSDISQFEYKKYSALYNVDGLLEGVAPLQLDERITAIDQRLEILKDYDKAWVQPLEDISKIITHKETLTLEEISTALDRAKMTSFTAKEIAFSLGNTDFDKGKDAIAVQGVLYHIDPTFFKKSDGKIPKESSAVDGDFQGGSTTAVQRFKQFYYDTQVKNGVPESERITVNNIVDQDFKNMVRETINSRITTEKDNRINQPKSYQTLSEQETQQLTQLKTGLESHQPRIETNVSGLLREVVNNHEIKQDQLSAVNKALEALKGIKEGEVPYSVIKEHISGHNISLSMSEVTFALVNRDSLDLNNSEDVKKLQAYIRECNPALLTAEDIKTGKFGPKTQGAFATLTGENVADVKKLTSIDGTTISALIEKNQLNPKTVSELTLELAGIKANLERDIESNQPMVDKIQIHLNPIEAVPFGDVNVDHYIKALLQGDQAGMEMAANAIEAELAPTNQAVYDAFKLGVVNQEKMLAQNDIQHTSRNIS